MDSESPIKAPSSRLNSQYEGFVAGYDSKGSGLFSGGGGTARSKRRRYRGWTKNQLPNLNLYNREEIKELPDFDPDLEFVYSGRDLLLLAEKILLNDPKSPDREPRILFMDGLKRRTKHEIYTVEGTPDPSIVKGIYNRTHPNGLRISTEEQRRKNGASYYR